MSSAHKKQRHEAKRKAKKKEARRRESGSPIKRLADAKGELECWISEDDDGNRQRQIFAFKRAAGLSGVACFLIDRGVVGLKDAWSRMEVEAEDRDHMLNAGRSRGFTMKRIADEEARRWVSGAARWAHDNGMRLPKEWIKCAALIGGAGEWQSADVSEFARQFVGHPEDLRQRLIGEPYVSYLKRKDVDFIFDESAPYMDQKTGDYMNDDEGELLDELDESGLKEILDDIPKEQFETFKEALSNAALDMTAATTSWLKARGETPSSELLEAWQGTVVSLLLAANAAPKGDGRAIGELTQKLIAAYSMKIEDDCRDEFDRAVEQILEHLADHPEVLLDAMRKYGVDKAPEAGAADEKAS